MITVVSEQVDAPKEIQAQLFWPVDDPILVSAPMINQTVVSIQRMVSGEPTYALMTMGHFAPPLFAGDNRQQIASAQAMAAESGGLLPVRIQPVARVAVTIEHLREIARVCDDTVKQWETMLAAPKPEVEQS